MKYGLIAGNGRFPFLVIEGAKRVGASVSVAAIHEETSREIENLADRLSWVGIGQLGKMIRFFKDEGVERAIMAGQVKHFQIFSRTIPDARMLKLLLKLPRRNTDSLISAIADELAAEGIELIDSTYFLKDSVPQAGILTRRGPGTRERLDIDYGLEIAGKVGGLNLGQTIVVRGKACVAIEAMEGTDATIRRAGQLTRGRSGATILGKRANLAGGHLTVVKLARPDQDMRFDVPVVGIPTLE
ncbi:MAG TPA: UDP-2,3-diacylglucosamine diphosphatase LpxI, partial [Pyrinomonadaceae bacterium]|nr:UDP-2,3-diacylglucosamine diphosphatase LpxI [Pyrinomonadaceae bacterium]